MAINIIPSVTSLFIPEGKESSFKIKLSEKPANNVKISVFRSAGSESIQVKTASLSFSTTDWNTEKKVFLKALTDGDSQNDQATITLSGNGLISVSITAIQQDNSKSQPNAQHVVIDPVTRIEGHLKIETKVEGGKVSAAWSTATLFRGIERILAGRVPTDAPLITQRLCGVCTYIHMLTSSRCLEQAYAVNIPENAMIVRNLLLGTQFVHDHIVHFYHLNAMDWVDLVSALKADPAAAAKLAHPLAPAIDFAAVQKRLQTFADSGQLGPFKNAYWGHGAYRFTPEQNLLLMSHYLEALKEQAQVARMHAIFGGKNPHPHSVVVGGVTCSGELGQQKRLEEFRSLLNAAIRFVETVYLHDVKVLTGVYGDWAAIGGFDNLMSFGEFPLGPNEPEDLFMPRGIIRNRAFSIEPVDLSKISEHVAHSWYEGTTSRHPTAGETLPKYTGFDAEDRYSWLKAPRYNGSPMEVGPLARVLVAYASGHAETVQAVDQFIGTVGLTIDGMFSTLGRTAARAIETQIIGNAMLGWLDRLAQNIHDGDKQVFEIYAAGTKCQGVGLNEAPRGALGHWADIDNGRLANYQMVVPSTWNFSPRCAQNYPGPVEQALLNTPVQDPSKPLEILRVLHSYDPCIACGVHVIDPRQNEVARVVVR